MQILLKYTERYEHILDEFPEDALGARFNLEVLPPPSRKLTLCILKYLNLCAEEFYLQSRHYLDKEVWQIWEGDLKRMIASPLVQREWSSLRSEFESHPAFLQYVERIQTEYRVMGVPPTSDAGDE